MAALRAQGDEGEGATPGGSAGGPAPSCAASAAEIALGERSERELVLHRQRRRRVRGRRRSTATPGFDAMRPAPDSDLRSSPVLDSGATESITAPPGHVASSGPTAGSAAESACSADGYDEVMPTTRPCARLCARDDHPKAATIHFSQVRDSLLFDVAVLATRLGAWVQTIHTTKFRLHKAVSVDEAFRVTRRALPECLRVYKNGWRVTIRRPLAQLVPEFPPARAEASATPAPSGSRMPRARARATDAIAARATTVL